MHESAHDEETILDIKTTAPMTVLSAERMITIPDVAAVGAELCPALMQDAERHGLAISGPWIFVSHGLPMDARTTFKIEFCLPVTMQDSYEGDFELKTLGPMLCAAGHHEGPLRTLFSDGYGKLLQAITAAGHRFSGESREIYHRWQGPDATGNRIEIQFGLQ